MSSKAVLISIRPEWCGKIISGEKTIEVRKTRPKLQTPYKCYIYCTAGNLSYKTPKRNDCHCCGCREVIGEFTCERISLIAYDGGELSSTTNAAFSPATCLSQEEIITYIGDKGRCYGWHISNLKIYDTPRELGEFRRACPNSWYCESCAMHWKNNGTCGSESLQIKRAPQSWCYVEELQNG